MSETRNGLRACVPIYSEDRDLATRIAEGRNRKQRTKGAMTYTGRHSFEVHYQGALAEVALAKYYGVDVDERFFDGHGDEGDDLVIQGKAVQVKTTSYPDDPLLRVEAHKPVTSAYYFLCVVDLHSRYVEIVGWASKSEILSAPRRSFKKNLHENYVLSERDLHRCRHREAVA